MIGGPGVAAASEPADAVTVVAATPLPGSGIDIDKTPGATQTLSAADLALAGTPDATGALADRLASVSLGDSLDDAFQPDILYRGFTASPVLGTPQGLAVYQSGVRVNEAFGETVNWDLAPDIAIKRLSIVGANPVFGLNALGGAVVLTMKTGFDSPGGHGEISGGSFGRRAALIDYGVDGTTFGVYLAARGLEADGWRTSSPDRVRQVYADVGARRGALTVDLSFTGAVNHLSGQGAAPVQELTVGRNLIFTNPQNNTDKLAFVTLGGTYAATPILSLQSVMYYRRFRQDAGNGNTTTYGACGAGPDLGALCQNDGATPLSDAAGRAIPDISQNGTLPIGQNDRSSIRSDSYGGSAQATSAAPWFDRENHLAAGFSLDRARTGFNSSVEVGVINAALTVTPSGLFVKTPENTPFSATPVSLVASSTTFGLFATDTFSLNPHLAVTAGGRYNNVLINLRDRQGAELNGRSRYARFNPALGATYQFSPALTAYVGYSEGSRAPSPSEIECSNPLRPCLLPSSLASDPPTLRQVVARTWEAGVRGSLGSPTGRGAVVTWSLGVFRAQLHDDIYAVATALGAGYFQNIGATRRQGVEAGVRYQSRAVTLFANYSMIDARFRSPFDLPSPSSPFADANGNVHVRPGDRLPGIPRHRMKVGGDVAVRRGWTVGATAAWVSGQIYRGDESNQTGVLPGYGVINLHSTLTLMPRLSLFATLNNALNARYSTFGVLGDPTGVGAPGVPSEGADPRFQSPAAPRAVFGGVRVTF